MRVVGGALSGRRLAAPGGREIRPTADRLRESLFNILAHGPPNLRRDLAGGGPDPVYEDARPGDVRHSLADLTAASELLGYAPMNGVETGLAELVAAACDRHRLSRV